MRPTPIEFSDSVSGLPKNATQYVVFRVLVGLEEALAGHSKNGVFVVCMRRKSELWFQLKHVFPIALHRLLSREISERKDSESTGGAAGGGGGGGGLLGRMSRAVLN